jgi:hypothetical protein
MRVDSIELAHPPDRILVACKQALAELGWRGDASGAGLQLRAREDESKLCCRQAPIEVEIELEERAEKTNIRVSGSVAGFGPVSSQSLRGRMEALWRHLFAALDRHAASAGSSQASEQPGCDAG